MGMVRDMKLESEYGVAFIRMDLQLDNALGHEVHAANSFHDPFLETIISGINQDLREEGFGDPRQLGQLLSSHGGHPV